MLARRIPSILPDLTFEEALEITKIHSISGKLTQKCPLITTRPFRVPHHTISPISLIGGGKVPKPGEISLAHYGVLFLDELPEFNKNTLEVLRAPLEDNIVTISRVNATLTYPCDFMFVASMNPCPCGFYGASDKECNCSEQAINRYMGKITDERLIKEFNKIGITGNDPEDYKKYPNKSLYESALKAREEYDPTIICFSEFDIVKLLEKNSDKEMEM